jgi:hypothetical protein
MKIEIDSQRGVATINGVDISFDLLDVMTSPKAGYVYQFRRTPGEFGDLVMVREWPVHQISFPPGQPPWD